MKCKNCASLITIDGFSGERQYASAKLAMDNNVKNSFFEFIESSVFETKYRCLSCGTVWLLGKPDFPAAGYFTEETDQRGF